MQTEYKPPVSNLNLYTLTQEQFQNLKEITSEYEKGMLSLNSLPNNRVTIYGGSRVPMEHPFYKEVYHLASEFAKRGWGVVTGGGPGIMSAGLEGAKSQGGKAIAYKIHLPNEPIFENSDIMVEFKNFPPRKYVLRQSDVFIFAPGGLGTLDEMMENLTLIQTHNYPIKPIYLLNRDYWKSMIEWIDKVVIKKFGLASADMHNFYKIMNTSEEIVCDLFGNCLIKKEV
jgi:uncharacterized protein (TIGR00730 family)